ncbi:calcium-binding carrier [Thecamonas trahens ATCC 50062]|uniref:Calcium-binding carrier n=1 Tax=Thecamonas trahens ATCC 50062 TaxID=461836 RepID=A0A0L0DPQ8_THETB|nr:calcium-binding carrier [Thecamonas trahens ATCC 50062]KNC54289.1 calcium-binding carrier [Thecamonas trahens ATCC 50062]|eukprot:XP_013753754.1 calcium-binding carrier [Thecamonas trahens ATCC 50062]
MPLSCYNCGERHKAVSCPHACWLCGQSGHPCTKCTAGDETGVRALFAELAGSEGRVSNSDLRRKLEEWGLPEHRADDVFRAARPKAGAYLTEDEFVAYAMARLRYMRHLFEDMDASGSGSINRHELRAALKVLRLEPTEDDVRAMIAKIDKPSGVGAKVPPNGKIEWHEFRDFMVLVSPTGRFLDFTPLADQWLTVSHEEFAGMGSGRSAAATGPASRNKAYTAINGGFALGFSRFCVAPLERLRMQMIVDSTKYKGTWDCFRSIYRAEGLAGYWRGNTVNMIRIVPQGAVAFVAKDFFKELFGGSSPNSLQLALASMAAGATCMSAIYPLDLARGVAALYKGIGPANVWATVYYATSFWTFDTLKAAYNEHVATDEASKAGPMVGLGIGAVAGIASTTAAFPLELARRKLQMQGTGGRPVQYTGLTDVLVKVSKRRGVLSLFSGLKANLIKSPLGSAIAFWAYETVNKALDVYLPEHMR